MVADYIGNIKVVGMKPVWIVWGKTDLTEGKGSRFVKHVCEIMATANRLAYKKGVQGSNCSVEKSMAYRLEGEGLDNTHMWYALTYIERPTKNDKERQEKIDRVEEVVAKAESVGLTKEEIRTLLWGGNER